MKNCNEKISRGLQYIKALADLDKQDTLGLKRCIERALQRVRTTHRNSEFEGDNQLLADLFKWLERLMGDRFRVDFSKFYQPVQFSGSALVSLICFGVGMASNFLGPSQTVNLLWNPFSLLLVWNAFIAAAALVYFVFVLSSRGRWRINLVADRVVRDINHFPALVHGLLLKSSGLISRWFRSGFSRGPHSLFHKAQFVSKLKWLQKHPEIRDRTVSLRLHWWAAVFMVGVVSGLCLRGVVMSYSFVWESTFIQSEQTLRDFLGFLFAPILSLPAFPDGLPRLDGTENAKWIVLLSLSAFVYVIIPRLMFAAISFYRLCSLRANLDPSKETPFAKHLLARLKQLPLQLYLYSFSYQLEQGKLQRLTASLNTLLPGKLMLSEYQNFGWETANVNIDVEPNGPSLWVACMNGIQTPEPEVHGVFLSSVWQKFENCEQDKYGLVLIDIQKVDLDRAKQRITAWEQLISQVDPQITFAFVDFSSDMQSQPIQNQLAEALWRSD